ncbi:MAG: hypothetical protein ACJ73L_06600 [Actinomycetes bacterium]
MGEPPRRPVRFRGIPSFDQPLEFDMKRVLAVSAIAPLMLLAFAGTASAASNPAGSGQPGAECGDAGATSSPAGFNTAGFANAETHYAGSDGTPSLRSGNSHAVSQYDIACYQVTQNH